MGKYMDAAGVEALWGNFKEKGAKIEVGSYVGTGTSGQNGANVLHFPFEPEFVFVFEQELSNWGRAALVFVRPCNFGGIMGVATFENFPFLHLDATWEGNSLSWCLYDGNNPEDFWVNDQKNALNATYHYIAIG